MAADARQTRRGPVFALLTVVALTVLAAQGAAAYAVVAARPSEHGIEAVRTGALQAIALSSAGALAILMLFAVRIDQRLNDIVFERSTTRRATPRKSKPARGGRTGCNGRQLGVGYSHLLEWTVG